MRALTFLTACLLACVSNTHPAGAQQALDTVDGRTFFLPLITREASLHGLPPEIADAVAMVETGYRPNAIGSSGEIGLMQVMPATAAQLGFRGTLSELADPETNIRLGVTYLARAWSEGGGDICRALTKYRAGLSEEVITPLSAQYCARATAWLMSGHGLEAADPAVQAPDPYVIVMPAAHPVPMPSLPEGVRLTPMFAMARATAPLDLPAPDRAGRLARPARKRQRAAEIANILSAGD